MKATTFARFKEYDNILPYTAKVKEEYEKLSQEEKERQHFKATLNEALLLEEKLKEGKESVDEKVAVKIDNQIYQKEIVKIKDDAKPISKFKDEQIINNPKEMFIGNTEYKTGNNSIKEIIDSDKTI